MIKRIGLITLSLSVSLSIAACNSSILNKIPSSGIAVTELTDNSNIVDLGKISNGIKTGVSVSVRIGGSSTGFNTKTVLPVAPALIKDIKSYSVGLCTNPSDPLNSVAAGPVSVNRDGTVLASPHNITFINVPVGGPYYAVVSAFDGLNGTGNNITESFAANTGIKAAVSSNSVTVNNDLTLNPSGQMLFVNLKLQGSKPGDEDFKVGFGTAPSQNTPDISADALGNGLVVWSDNRNSGTSGIDIFARVMRNYNFVGSDIQINIMATGDQTEPSVSLNTAGDGLVVWKGSNGAANNIIHGLKIHNYAPFGAEFVIPSVTTSEQGEPSVMIDFSGNGFVVWEDNRNGNYDIYGKKISAFVPSAGGDVLISAAPDGDQKNPRVSINGLNGNGIVVWNDNRTSYPNSIFARTILSFTPDTEYQINPIDESAHFNPSVSMNPDTGNGLITWQRIGEILALNINNFIPNVPNSAFQVSQISPSSKEFPDVALDPNGNGFITWIDLREGPAKIYGKKVTNYSATSATSDISISTSATSTYQLYPVVSINENGGGIVVWGDHSGATDTIFARHLIGFNPFTNQPPPPPALNKIVFFTNRGDGIHNNIYMMNPDGTNVIALTNATTYDNYDPSWSPDGTKILFSSTQTSSEDIFVMNADGSNQVNLTNFPGPDYYPSWSPNSAKVAFTSLRDGNEEIYTMDAVGGTNQTRLTNNTSTDFYPEWSPIDGAKILFTSERDVNKEIYVMNSDGTNPVNLTNNPSNDLYASWSPDGTKVVFTSDRDGGNYEVYIMNSDGTNQTRLTTTSNFDDHASWSPDGSKIVFQTNRDAGNWEIYSMNADGSNQTRLTNIPPDDMGPKWK